ncbi:hypothetical protein AMES_5543 [Amycolatopsis mediterranei S699]|uniref:Uncharacterized protein n=2 Tax=Amycolatopsis mediterranei TaxID=33910 RepID=A0A0H3DBA9_AMYMU|nr:hypothetical protein [Amycolatopsis mediterranei]ADJ47368.1 hypothetical protein AMED_5615 [Amycolatopsis mediterranei U32]AEK44211.1 hypothetical protein RAM_28670 [Amycolatopsis mediterranei S699]AFO79079.1 hypothetical protein AMES_5543 [Amycolatopsis mediterranei S699]AGT86207.1 hypothetical protein B737_5543 [Amycolatopsis mediterranei RB]KDO12446.1 hypothetical protein DV26_01975 [Amycolatopsis mediterranei]
MRFDDRGQTVQLAEHTCGHGRIRFGRDPAQYLIELPLRRATNDGAQVIQWTADGGHPVAA